MVLKNKTTQLVSPVQSYLIWKFNFCQCLQCVFPPPAHITETYTPGHEVGEAPVILFVEEQVTDPAAEGLFIIFVVDDLQHGLSVARP